jgi:hypothetical protein
MLHAGRINHKADYIGKVPRACKSQLLGDRGVKTI